MHFRLEGFLVKPTTCFVVLALVFGMASISATEPFETFLKKHCVRCHGSQKEEGDIRIDRLSRAFKAGVDSHHWADALGKVNSGEMPPEDELQSSSHDAARKLETNPVW